MGIGTGENLQNTFLFDFCVTLHALIASECTQASRVLKSINSLSG